MIDYRMYLHRRAAMFASPHIRRAALKYGGIIWRLAVEDSGMDLQEMLHDSIAGPSPQALRTQRHTHIVINSNEEFKDDGLNEFELNDIVGCLLQQAAHGVERCTIVSWWPRSTLWDNADVNCGFWTVENERWYQKYKSYLEHGSAKPKKWTQIGGSIKHTRLLNRRYLDVSANLILVSFALT